MATIRILLGIICFAFVGGSNYPGSHLLDEPRKKLLCIAAAEIGVREKTGNNDGDRVEEYLKTVNLKKGNPWCAAFVSWVFAKAGYAAPRTAWSPALFISSVQSKKIQSGNVFAIYIPRLNRIGHVGIVERKDGDWLIAIEGNTNSEGSREGDGVYRKRRHLRTIYAYADWIAKDGGDQ